MKIHNPNSRLVRVGDLMKGQRIEPGYLDEQEVTIEADAKKVLDTNVFCILFKRPDGSVDCEHGYEGDAVWVLP